MAQGGTMGSQGPDFSPPGYSVIVGEGALNGDEEVVTRLNDGTTLITPLKGGAATGATLPYDPSTSFSALRPLFEPFGFSDYGGLPRFGAPATYERTGGGQNAAQRLGYRSTPTYYEPGTIGPQYEPLVVGPDRVLLPSLSAAAGYLNSLRVTDPVRYRLAIQAYQNAVSPTGQPRGISPEQMAELIQQPFPTGVPRQVLGYR